jgi:hypothetical protein
MKKRFVAAIAVPVAVLGGASLTLSDAGPVSAYSTCNRYTLISGQWQCTQVVNCTIYSGEYYTCDDGTSNMPRGYRSN